MIHFINKNSGSLHLAKTVTIYFIIFIICFEAASFLYWHTLSRHKLYFDGYVKQLESVTLWFYDDQTGVFFPAANYSKTYFGPEFIDIADFAQVPGTRITLPDDGLDSSSKYTFLAIGDSMTAGVGSLNHIENNWVEYVERKINGLDFINGAYSAGATESQLVFYKKIHRFIPHETVVLNFFTGNDYVVYDLSERITGGKYLPEKINKTEWVRKAQLARSYMHGCEKMRGKPFSYRVLTTVVRNIPWLAKHFPRCGPNLRAPPGQNNPELQRYVESFLRIQEKMKEARRTEAEDKLAEMDKGSVNIFQRDVNFYIQKTEYDREFSNLISEIAARKVNDFHRFVRSLGKRFLLFIHPKKSEVHFDTDFERSPIFVHKGRGVKERAELPKIDLDYTRLRFKERLDQDMTVFDLTESLRDIANRDPKQFLYWRLDSHYNPYGYMMVGEVLCEHLVKILDIPERKKACRPTEKDLRKLDKLRRDNNDFFYAKKRY